MSEAKLLLSSTLRLYRKALSVSFKNFRAVWWLPLVHTLVAALISIPLGIVVGLLGIVGSFIAGLFLALVVAAYLASLGAAHRKESQRGVFSNAQAMFFPVIHVLFLFFIIELVFGFIARGPETYWIRASLALLISIFANAVPECIYVRGITGSQMFSESFEFIIENWLEWFIPILIPLGAFLLFSGSSLAMLLSLAQIHPFDLIERFIFTAGALARIPQVWLYLIAAVYCLFFVALFRAALYEELTYSTRRKRLYAERTGI